MSIQEFADSSRIQNVRLHNGADVEQILSPDLAEIHTYVDEAMLREGMDLATFKALHF